MYLGKIKSIFLVLALLFLITLTSTPVYAVDHQYTYQTSGFNQNQSELEMLNYINKARQEEGLAPLKMADQIVEVARIKSQDMIDNNYFSHTSPTYGSPFEMMENFGISYLTAGENLAGHYSVKGAHEALMKSPGHKRNILNPSFTHIGIGIVKGGPYGMMFTQLFVGQPEFQEEVGQSQSEEDVKENNEEQENQNWVEILGNLINDEREKNGLPRLNLNKDLMQAAQIKAEEMVEKEYLSYYSPTYGYAKDMLKALDIPFQEVKENIVGAYDVQVAHNALMNSKKHRDIILSTEYQEMGLGVQSGGRYGFSIVELFVKSKLNNQQQTKPEFQTEPKSETNPGLKVEPEKNPDYPLEYQNSQSQLEKDMFNLINDERRKLGLNELTLNKELARIAHMKAQDMEDKDYLSYKSVTYGRTSEMLNANGIKYYTMGESIVAASKIEPAHRALMNTSRHKGYLLNPSFQEIGIGIVKSERYGYIIVEIFLESEKQTNSKPDLQSGTKSTSEQGNKGKQLTSQEQKEYEMLDLVNEARRQAGVAPLKMDSELVKVARLKSQDMIKSNYFSHTSPTYGSPFAMMSQFGIDYRRAGENLAGHNSVAGAHEALMNSSGHRRNILDPNFTHIGIGIVEGGPYGMMFTQMFVGY